MDINELRQKRAKIWDDAKALLAKAEAEKRDLTAEEETQYAAMTADIDKHKRTIDREEEKETRDAEMAALQRAAEQNGGGNAPPAGAPTQEQRAMALGAWLTVGTKVELKDPEHLRAVQLCGMNLAAKEVGFPVLRGADYRKQQREYRALSAVTGSAGGYTIPEGFVHNLEVALLAFGGVRQVAEVIRTTAGNPLPWPTANDTANVGEIISENTTIGVSVDPVFGVMTLNAYKYSSKAVLVPYELLEDSAFDLAGQIGSWCGERIGRIQNLHFTVGDGNAKPFGIVPASTVGPTTASATAIISDELLDLIHSVDPAYRGPGAGFMFHDNVLLALRKLKEATTNAYIWSPGLSVGVPDTLLGYPYTVNQQMASSIAATALIALFGQLNKYKIRDVNEVRMVRLNERYADLDQIGFIAFMRSDGDLLDAGTHPVKHLLMHA